MTRQLGFVAETPGIRLDKFVGEHCPELSRTYAQKLIADGLITVNGRVAKASLKLDTGDKVNVIIPPETPLSLEPESILLNILYEDADLMVINKPAGLTVHPAPGHPGHTLVNAVLNYLPELADEEDSLRPGIVHRLDKDTSGLILVAKNRVAQANLSEQFSSRSVAKSHVRIRTSGLSRLLVSSLRPLAKNRTGTISPGFSLFSPWNFCTGCQGVDSVSSSSLWETLIWPLAAISE